MIRPSVARTRSSMSATTPAVLRGRAGRRPTWPARTRSTTRLTVLWVVPHPAQGGGGPVAPQRRVGAHDLHLVPRRLHAAPLRPWRLVWSNTITIARAEGCRQAQVTRGRGLSVAITGDFAMATDRRAGTSTAPLQLTHNQ